jgi:5-deoxy-glucuronate isomerase
MKHLYNCPAAPGFNRILNPGDSEMELTGFALINLRAGEKHAVNVTRTEVALVVLGGRCTVRAGGDEFRNIGERKDVFSGLPYTVYLPAETGYEIEALTDVEVAVAESPSTQKGRPVLIGPEQVRTLALGRDNFTRQALIMIDDKFPSDHFFIGEAIVPPGNWGSFPPHRHEFDNPPDELDMEEIYFYRFNPGQGFGIQALYTDARDVDTAYTVRHNDTIAIPRGYHPVVNAPGYTMYFLWVMTGRKRGFINHKDPQHSWIK